jgi:FMN-dependent NADH-azoreductase
MSTLNILKIDASASGEASVTRKLTQAIVKHAQNQSQGAQLVERDLSDNTTPLLTGEMIGSYFTRPEERNAEQENVLETSNLYVSELSKADVIVIGAPMYNFSVPAVLKAYIDQVARVGVTFKYGPEGPVGLLENKKAIVAVSTGGTPTGSPYDFVTPYLKTFLGFIGITDVSFIAIDERSDADELFHKAETDIQALQIP